MTRPDRLKLLDDLRGLAVATMVVFHTCYDMHMFGFNQLDFRHGFWFGFPRFIVFLFLWCVGAGLQLAHGQGVRWASYNRRLAKLIGLSLLISLGTYWAFPQSWIYFGTLHCIAAASLLALPFLFWPQLRLPAFVAILVAQYALGYDIEWVSSIIQRNSMDFIPVYPWFWVVLLGMLSGPWILRRFGHGLRHDLGLAFLGRHALKIYLIHQPLLYGIMAGWHSFMRG